MPMRGSSMMPPARNWRYDLSEDASSNTSLIFVELYRGPQVDIKVKAIGEGWASGLAGLAGSMGVTLG